MVVNVSLDTIVTVDEEGGNSRMVAAEELNVLNLLDICRNMQFVGQEIVNKTD